MSAQPEPGSRPTGRDEVKAAILTTAERLFRERGVAEVSLREITREAGVNHGLAHRHFGSKEALLAALFRRSSVEGAARLRGFDSLDQALRNLADTTRTGSYVSVLAAAIADGADPARFASGGDATQVLVELLQRERGTPRVDGTADAVEPFDAPMVAAAVFALLMGWRMFGPFIAATTGLAEAAPDDLEAEFARILVCMTTAVPIEPAAGD